MSTELPFSRRNNYHAATSEITVREDAPEQLRIAVADVSYSCGWGPSALRGIVCKVLRKRPDPSNWSDYPNVDGEVRDLLDECPWFKIYDVIEAVYQDIADGIRLRVAKRFSDEINSVFMELGIGWQLKDGQIITRGDTAFEQNIGVARTELTAKGRFTAADRLRKAVDYLSIRPRPDTSGAISHATAAMECVLHDLTGETVTLGDYLKRFPDLAPGSMKKGLEGLWGFASQEGARHGREGVEPSWEDAAFIVAVAAAFSTYLNRKHTDV